MIEFETVQVVTSDLNANVEATSIRTFPSRAFLSDTPTPTLDNTQFYAVYRQ